MNAPSKRIDALTYDFFCLSETERILVEDTVEHTIPAAQPNRGSRPEIWNASAPSDRRAYARTLVDNLADWLDDDCAIRTRLVARNDDLAVLRLTLQDGRGAFDYAEDDKASVGAALSRLARTIEQPIPGNFQSTPDFRVFLDRDLFLVKPAAKRFWLRSAAMADAPRHCARPAGASSDGMAFVRVRTDARWRPRRLGRPVPVVRRAVSRSCRGRVARVYRQVAEAAGRGPHHRQGGPHHQSIWWIF